VADGADERARKFVAKSAETRKNGWNTSGRGYYRGALKENYKVAGKGPEEGGEGVGGREAKRIPGRRI